MMALRDFKLVSVLVLCTLVGYSTSRSWRQMGSENFFGVGTTDLTISILQSDIENNTNIVFSPLGYSAILAILSEGARGNTRNQLFKALRLPEDTFALRNTYKNVLSNMQEHNVINKPEFKNWFYVYKNYSVEESYKKTLADNYLTIVKEIERDYYYSSTSQDKDENKKQEETQTEDNVTNVPSSTEGIDKVDLERNGSLKEKEEDNEAKELKKQSEVITKKKSGLLMEKIIARKIKDEQGGVAAEKEMLSALSANRLSALNQTDSEGNSEDKSESKMIIFNALYFRGNWSTPFTKKSNKKEVFYLSETEKTQVEMISSEGEYEYGIVSELDATAIELPYQGDRYSLLLLVPNERNGLKKLISNLRRDSLKDIDKYLTKVPVEVCIPKFQFYTITRPKNALTKCGVTDIFNDAADLSGITGMKGLYLDDLVQLVAVEVDETSSEHNFLTTTALTRSVLAKFKADQPFLFFLRDRVDNFVVVAGKVQDPTVSNEQNNS